MAKLRLKRWEIKEYELPPVCAKCGQPAVTSSPKRFSWHPSWVIVLIFVGLLVYVIVAVILTKRMTVPLPFCERHRNYWRNRLIAVWGGLLGVLLVAAAGTAIAAALDPSGPDSAFGFACFGSIVLFLVWLIAVAIMQSMSIRPNEITDKSITLVGLSAEFVDAVYDERDAEQEAERRSRDRDRDRGDAPRGRRSKDDDERYFDPKDRRRVQKDVDEGGQHGRKKEDRRRDHDDDY